MKYRMRYLIIDEVFDLERGTLIVGDVPEEFDGEFNVGDSIEIHNPNHYTIWTTITGKDLELCYPINIKDKGKAFGFFISARTDKSKIHRGAKFWKLSGGIKII
jgi:hypothetical protein